MTGYASGLAQVGSVSLDLEIKSVNSKSLDLKIYLPEYLSSLENELRQVALGKVFRGSVFFKIKVPNLFKLILLSLLSINAWKNCLTKKRLSFWDSPNLFVIFFAKSFFVTDKY